MNHLNTCRRALPAMLLIMLLLPAMALADKAPSPEVAEQMADLVGMCDASAEARAARQGAAPLYDRLGGYDRILELTTEIVANHAKNPDFSAMMARFDNAQLARHVADFMAAGTGGTQKYTGRDLVLAHTNLHLTESDFLSAGNDVVMAMKTKGYGEDEINEVVCILVSLKEHVLHK